jgi:(2R)-3-sulfolactate dehydrogenase (NADP+)
MSEPTEHLSIDEAHELLKTALLASGVPHNAASSVATALVVAEAEGRSGHGFIRLPDYVAQVESGKVKADAQISVAQTQVSSVTVDAGHGFAYPALDVAIRKLTLLARQQGCASAMIHRSHHCGVLSVHVEKLAEAGLVGLMVANSPAAIAPWGAKEAVYGTNPIAFSAPRENGPPIVIDLSVSQVARGPIVKAARAGESIPEGWSLDAEGKPTTDAKAALDGTMVPIGGAKGTALALMVEVLAAALTGANFSHEQTSFFSADGPPPGTGQFLIAFKPLDAAAFLGRIEVLLSMIEGMDGTRLPGARRHEAMAKARRDGLNISKQYLDAARDIAASASAQDSQTQ